jgi:acetylornithine/succinyldiaminopimelate/putrescine aminotransferase
MSSEYYSASFKPLLPHVKFIELNNEASLSAIDSDTAAIFIECIQAESGYIPAEPEFLNALQQKARYHNCLIVCDEVQSGLMRTGSMWAFEHGPLKPDVLIMAKGLGGGMPIGCFASSREIMSSLSDDPILGHITTFGGHPVSCAAANACLDVLKEIRGSEILRKEQLFRNGLKHPDIRSISGRGLLLSMELESFERVQKVISAAYRNGLIIDWFLYNLNKLRLAPPLIISDKEILKVCRILNESLELTRT